MNGIRDLLIGTIGSVIGAIIVLIATSGVRFTRKASQRASERKAQEKKLWHEGTMGERQDITNEYLFGILKNMLLGNLLWTLPTAAYPFASIYSYNAVNAFTAAGAIAGSVYYFRGITLVLRYIEVKSDKK